MNNIQNENVFAKLEDDESSLTIKEKAKFNNS